MGRKVASLFNRVFSPSSSEQYQNQQSLQPVHQPHHRPHNHPPDHPPDHPHSRPPACPPAMPPTHLHTLTKQWGYHAVKGYELNNNTWGLKHATSGGQRTHYDGPGPEGRGIAWSSDWEWQGGEHQVKSYVYGARQFDRPLLQDIASMPVDVAWRYDTDHIRANVAFDFFTDPDKKHANSSGEYEVMIWLACYGGVWPISEAKRPIARVNIAGYDWDLHFGYNHGGKMKVFSFIPAGPNIHHFEADMKEFFDYLVFHQGFPDRDQHLLIYQFGTEVFTGGPAFFEVPKFIAEVNTCG